MGRQRDESAEVYLALAPAVFGYLRAQRVADPEDVLGEVFLQVARDLPRFRGGDAALRRWVFSIAHNRVIDDVRRRARRREELTAEPLDGPGGIDAVADGAWDPALVDAVHGLTADQREVVLLRFVADLSIEQVAGLTDRTPGAVKSLQHRALENLARAVSPAPTSPLT